MTERKSLKRRVRVRMSKTGERYAAARRQLLAKTPPAATPAAGQPVNLPTPARNDDLVVARTGRTWDDWFELLATWGAADRPHPEIARFLNAELGVDGWWSQNITVEFEKAIGRRQVGQRADGWFVATASKTLGVPVEVAFDAVVDETRRAQWLADAPLRLRGTTARKIARFDWDDGTTRVMVTFDPKGETRTVVALEHQRLFDADQAEQLKAYWRERLGRLRDLLES